MPIDISKPLPPCSPANEVTKVVRAGIPTLDRCPILTRLKAFIVSQGVVNTLEHTFRDEKGRPINLEGLVGEVAYIEDALAGSVSSPESASLSEELLMQDRVCLRVKEWLGEGLQPAQNPIYTLFGTSPAPDKGEVRVDLTPAVTAHAGIYELSWAILSGDGSAATMTPVLIDRGLLSVERSLFPPADYILWKNLGPPTLQEVRMRLMDSSPSENLLLQDLEFKDEQILLALFEPIRYWNETPPPNLRFTTRNFPYRGAWIRGVLGQLHLMATAHYRRNRLNHSAGGVSVDDLNKEREYMTEGTRSWQEFQGWVGQEKTRINMKRQMGAVLSEYSSRNGW